MNYKAAQTYSDIFKTLFSVGLAEVWTHDLLLNSLVLIQFIIHVRKMYNSQTNKFYLAHLKTPFHCKCQVQVKADFIYCCQLQKKGWRMKRGSQKILAGSRNLGSVFDKSRSLVFAWFVFTFFESWNFLPSLGLGFLTRISASRRVSDFTIRHP